MKSREGATDFLANIIDFPARFATPEEIDRHERLLRAAKQQDARDDFEASIPRKYRKASLDAPWLRDLVGRDKIACARAAIGADRVVFLGPPGAGKTSLAVAMLRARAQRGDFGARFVSAVRLGTARIQHGAGNGEAPYVAMAIKAPLILLDDVGEETQAVTNAVPDVISLRHDSALPLWITSGRLPPDIEAQYGGGRARRIFEDVVYIWLGQTPEAGEGAMGSRWPAHPHGRKRP